MSGKSPFKTEPPVRATINVAVIGASGNVGSCLLDLIAAGRSSVALRLVAVANSRAALIVRKGLASAQACARLRTAAPEAGFAAALAHLPRPLVVVDCTASAEVAAHYPRWLTAGIDVVTPNKFGPSADRPLARAIAAAQASSGALLRDSTTVGAQLPLLQTLRDLHAAGDRIEHFEAVLSGTLSYVLGSLQQGHALSAVVREAFALGYTEPHPASDLSGEDAARKLVILLRALGHDIELADVECVPLVDADLLDEPDPARAIERLPVIDETWRARVAIAQARHERWIYRASFDGTRARVAPERVACAHPLANLAPCENALILHSAYYRAAPLRIAGPGAGIDLTAAGVFADVLAAARRYVWRADSAIVEEFAAEVVEAAA